jgi:cation transport ATPase
MKFNEQADARISQSLEELNTTVIVLQGLYTQMNEERKVITLASGQMAHAAKQFEEHLVKFEAFEKACKQGVVERIKADLKHNIHETAQTIAKEVIDTVYDTIHQGIDAIRQSSREISEHRSKQKKAWRGLSVLFVVIALIGGGLGGFVVHNLSYPSKVMNKQRAAGEVLMRAWSKLSLVEQEKIKKLGGSHVS